MDYKLARVFMAARPGHESAAPHRDDIEMLAQVAHARWVASKALSGWRYGAVRDNRKLLHPDMIAYNDLDEPGKQKDRDEVAALSRFAALSGEALLAERRVAVAEPLGDSAFDALVEALKSCPQTQMPVAVLPLDSEPMAATASALMAAGIEVELVLDTTMDEIRHGADPKTPDYSDVLDAAWRIHVAMERPARQALKDRAPQTADREGKIHAR
jgi:hypothetical protein